MNLDALYRVAQKPRVNLSEPGIAALLRKGLVEKDWNRNDATGEAVRLTDAGRAYIERNEAGKKPVRLTITHNGFHGFTTVRITVNGAPGERVELSPAQIKKLDRAACGSSDCKCGESVARALARSQGGDWDRYQSPALFIILPQNGDEIRLTGNYPQR